MDKDSEEVKTEEELRAEVSASNDAVIELMMVTGFFSDEELDEDTRRAIEDSRRID
ncbi:MAG: hypothetical protein WA614_11135 [Acidimicrobiales bacterium]